MGGIKKSLLWLAFAVISLVAIGALAAGDWLTAFIAACLGAMFFPRQRAQARGSVRSGFDVDRKNSANSLAEHELKRLVGICEGILADDKVFQDEAMFLDRVLSKDRRYFLDHRTSGLAETVRRTLADGTLTLAEADELRVVLSEFCDKQLPQSATDTHSQTLARSTAVVPAARKKKAVTEDVERARTGDLFDFEYEDAAGDITSRTIRFIRSSTKNGVVYIDAFCMNRNALRTFRAERIISAVRVDTGEWVDDPVTYFSRRA